MRASRNSQQFLGLAALREGGATGKGRNLFNHRHRKGGAQLEQGLVTPVRPEWSRPRGNFSGRDRDRASMARFKWPHFETADYRSLVKLRPGARLYQGEESAGPGRSRMGGSVMGADDPT